MLEINAKEARKNLSAILDRVERGEEVIITRRGRRIARVSHPAEDMSPLKSLKMFRQGIRVKGDDLSQTVVDQRTEERF